MGPEFVRSRELSNPARWIAAFSATPLKTLSWLFGTALALAIAAALRASVSVSLPVAAAVLIALAMRPLACAVREALPVRLRWLGVVTAVLIVVALLALFVLGLAVAATQVATGIDQFGPAAQGQLQQTIMSGQLGSLVTEAQQLAGGAQNALVEVKGYARGLVFALWQTVAGLALILLLVLLMLSEGDAWSAKLAAITRADGRWHDAATAIGQRFRAYFLTTLGIGAATGLCYAVFLSVLGVRFAFVFALLGGLGNFIPSLGAVFTVALPALFALVIDGPTTALSVGGGLALIEIVMGNVVQPMITGDRLAISPLVIIVSLLVWGWIWGAAGALLAVPMTALLLIVFAHIPALAPIALMLSDKRSVPKMLGATRAR